MSETIRTMKKTILMALLAACGTNDPGDPHTLSACGSSWNGVMIGTRTFSSADKCELGCMEFVQNPTGPGCSATWIRNGSAASINCAKTITVDGASGCCTFDTGSDAPIQFAECQ